MLQQARVRTRRAWLLGSWIGLRVLAHWSGRLGTKRFASALLLPISGKLSEIESSDQGSKVKQVKQTLVPREFWKCIWKRSHLYDMTHLCAIIRFSFVWHFLRASQGRLLLNFDLIWSSQSLFLLQKPGCKSPGPRFSFEYFGDFHRKCTRSFFGRFLAFWAHIPASPGLVC